jgi:hypothetical protein
VVSLENGQAVEGKLTFSAAAIHVEGSSASDIKLTDVLEADFNDAPFHLQYFQSDGDSGNQLPAGWTAKAIGPADPAEAASYTAGTLTITGGGSGFGEPHPDHCFFAGMPWKGDGEWTAHLKELGPEGTPAQVGISLRKGLEEDSGGNSMLFPGDVPAWVRGTRVGNSVDTAFITDGKWDVNLQEPIYSDASWVGLMVNSRQEKATARAVIDHITFTPGPAQPGTVPPGVLLKSGSFLSGIKILSEPDFFLSGTDGGLTIDNKRISLKTGQIAAVVYHPVTQDELASSEGQQGLILKNGDFLASDVQLIQGGMAQMTSLALGQVGYYPDRIRACIANPVASLPSDYEVRLTDGSTIRAKNLSVTDGRMEIQEISGLSINVAVSEVAQVRAGLLRVQPLIALPWKVRDAAATPPAKPEVAATPSPVAPLATDADAAAAAKADALKADAANFAITTKPGVVTWAGPNQEEIMVVPAGTTLDFPMKGKFRSLSMRVALAPGLPGNAEAKLRILADGKEIKSVAAIKEGGAPSLINVMIQDPKLITFEVESATPGARMLTIDPVAVRTSGSR